MNSHQNIIDQLTQWDADRLTVSGVIDALIAEKDAQILHVAEQERIRIARLHENIKLVMDESKVKGESLTRERSFLLEVQGKIKGDNPAELVLPSDKIVSYPREGVMRIERKPRPWWHWRHWL